MLAPMPGRTFAIGDIHGDLDALFKLLSCFPPIEATDTMIFVGDYIDRGPKSAGVVDYLRHRLPRETAARVITLRGNHEDAWLRVVKQGWPEFVMPPGNGCLAALRSFRGLALPEDGEIPRPEERQALIKGEFFPADVIEWMEALPIFYEDKHAIYVHAGLPRNPKGGFFHPSEVEEPGKLLWCRDEQFFRHYRGKLVVFGHTATEYLPPELSTYTPDDPTDIWGGPCTIGLDTGAGKGGFLTGLELPALRVYESR
jgi:serine/threonine protein phosphatase 1